ncbi:Ig-like domain-containing protein [Streptomyces sp. TLI_171]|uniref:L,D-transpeptidase n=1 Tax=Streptomyces sp. TLI_171 TaxID=1938859 RepID=UPI000C19C50A|nr:Ig-like domain-containing protein [Streptomyces sp. TLI_171]RKE21223.1 lipoprotein-anchoring transpeptidase ErfK/SrfK [Streptomyces sp. TLI_171]
MRAVAGLWARRAAALSLVLLAGCSGAGRPSGGDAATAPAPPVSRARLELAPADGAQAVPVEGAVRVTVAQGRLLSVRLADDRGAEVPGTLTADGAGWAPDGTLAAATAYTLDAVAEDPAGLRAVQHAGFATAAPEHAFVAFFTPEDGSTVGVGMPVSLRFSGPVADRAAVERAVEVTADPPVEVGAHWFGDRRLDFRPRAYWAVGTRVTVALRLKGVAAAPGRLGVQDKDVHFTIGRSLVAAVDLDAHTMTVRQDGRVLRVLEISGGSPEHASYLGAMVVSERFEVTRMNSQTVGLGDEYDIKDVPHALRLTASGTFVHGNYWSDPEVFGEANTSHGCIGLADAKGGSADSPAGWLYRHVTVGDVVEVRGSQGDRVAPDNGLGDWNLNWAQWLRGSALPVH